MTVETEEDRVRRELKEAKKELKKNMKMQQWLEEKARRFVSSTTAVRWPSVAVTAMLFGEF